MPLEKLNAFTKKVSNLADKPNSTMSAAEVKAHFDAAPDEVRIYLNQLIDVLKSETDGDSGADNIKATPISSSPSTVQGILEWLKNQIDVYILGQIPDGTITNAKLSDDPTEIKALFETLQQYFTTHLDENASLTDKGHVLLSNSITGTSQSKAATELAVKDAKEKAIAEAISFAKSFGLGDIAIDISGSNLNALDANGFYKGQNIIGAPSANWYFYINLRHDASYGTQFAIGYATGGTDILVRTQDGGIWGPWKKKADDFMLASALTINNQTEFSFSGLNAYSDFEIRLLNINFGQESTGNSNLMVFNDDASTFGAFTGLHLLSTGTVQSSQTTSLTLGDKAQATAGNSYHTALIQARKLTANDAWDIRSNYRSMANANIRTGQVMGFFGTSTLGQATQLNKLSFKNSGNLNMISGRAELWVRS